MSITVLGAGIAGPWQAYTLTRRGHSVRLVERTATPFSNAASRLAGAMLSPYCEREGANLMVQELGVCGVALWREAFPGVTAMGSLVVALARNRAELGRFAERTEGHKALDANELAGLEPDLAGRFQQGLFFQGEAHVEPAEAMAFLLNAARRLGVDVVLGSSSAHVQGDIAIDCRGAGASKHSRRGRWSLISINAEYRRGRILWHRSRRRCRTDIKSLEVGGGRQIGMAFTHARTAKVSSWCSCGSEGTRYSTPGKPARTSAPAY